MLKVNRIGHCMKCGCMKSLGEDMKCKDCLKNKVAECIGCAFVKELDDDGICSECLNSPRRGRRWALMSHRVRRDPEFAKSIYDNIKNDNGRKMFAILYGVPKNCIPPEGFKPNLDLVVNIEYNK